MPFWRVEGSFKDRKCYAIEFDDRNNVLRKLGPVFHPLVAYGMISRLTKYEAEHGVASHPTIIPVKEPTCEMSARPSGQTCGSRIDLMITEYAQFGIAYSKQACASCREKMLRGTPREPLAWGWN